MAERTRYSSTENNKKINPSKFSSTDKRRSWNKTNIIIRIRCCLQMPSMKVMVDLDYPLGLFDFIQLGIKKLFQPENT